MKPARRLFWTWCVALSCSTACGDDAGKGGGGPGGTQGGGPGGAEGADESGGAPVPDPHGGECGDSAFGWLTRCSVIDTTATASDLGPIQGALGPNDETTRKLCCEGSPPDEVTDAGCTAFCILEQCEAARSAHLGRCNTCALTNCGFDMSDCLAGGSHSQTLACVSPLALSSYTLTVACDAQSNETRNDDGTFGFLDQPTNFVENDPDICGEAPS